MSASSTTPNIVIVGGGISGLSAAYYVRKFFRQRQQSVNITLIEKSEQAGGKIQTRHEDGFVIERGPDGFLSRKMPIIELSRELGVDKEWVPTNPEAKKTYILHRGKLHRMPPGLVLGIPTEWASFLKSGLVSLPGKVQTALDLIRPARQGDEDESLGHFLKRRLGPEVVDHIAEPLLSGIYAGDAYNLSLKSTFPQFKEIEEKKRSLILGMISDKKHNRSSSQLPELAKQSVFLSYRNGLGTLVHSLLEAMPDVRIRTGERVVALTKHNDGYSIQLQSGEDHTQNITHSAKQSGQDHLQNEADGQHVLNADSVIMATPAYVTASLLSSLSSVHLLEQIPYVSVANVVMSFDAAQLSSFDGSGFVVPRKEKYTITACTWTSSKWKHVAPDGQVLLRAYVGHAGDQAIVDEDDESILKQVLHDLRRIMGIHAHPKRYEVNRWYRAMPQYPVGHMENMALIRNHLSKDYPGIFLCGAGYAGVGIPDCIRQGKEAAQQVLAHFSHSSSA